MSTNPDKPIRAKLAELTCSILDFVARQQALIICLFILYWILKYPPDFLSVADWNILRILWFSLLVQLILLESANFIKNRAG